MSGPVAAGEAVAPGESVRRLVVAAGTARYAHLHPLPAVPADLETVTGTFAGLGYRVERRLLDVTAAELRAELSGWVAAEPREADALVLYVSGHGEVDHGRHYLLCADSREDRLAGTALAVEDLVRIVTENGVRRLLLLVDTCYAGQGGAEGARLVAEELGARLAATRGADEHRLEAYAVIAAARSQQTAEDGAFSRALAQAVADPALGGQRQPKLYLEQVVDRVNDALRRDNPHQHAVLGMLPSGAGFTFLPNPRYAPDLPGEGIDLAEQRVWLSPQARRRREELRAHFGPRGRGTDQVGTGHSTFTGRWAALAALTGWLDGDPPRPAGERTAGTRHPEPLAGRRAVLVTGSGGTGKSSLLGRLVLLADPEQRSTLPDLDPALDPPHTRVDTAIHARHQLLEEVVAAIADAAGVRATTPAALLAALHGRTHPLVVVVDALDEAGTAGGDQEPGRIATELLRPLAALDGVRLLVGARPRVAGALGDGFARIDLDDPRWNGAADVLDYARALLLAPDGPGSASPYTPRTAAPVADAVAERAAGNFLVARLVARALAHRAEALDTSAPAWRWREQLPTPGEGAARRAGPAFRWALRQELAGRGASEGDLDAPAGPGRAADDQRDAGDQAGYGRALLTALAFAEGTGLPAGPVWRAVATALAARPVGDADLRWIMDSAGAHIVEGLAAGRSVYRLYHESFAEELRADTDPDAAARIARALLDLVPTDPATGAPDWPGADAYLRDHLATHAAAGGLLDDLVGDPLFLLTAEPTGLQRALPVVTHPDAVAARAAYQRCAPLLAAPAEGDEDLPTRAAQLHLAAVQESADALADAVRRRFPDTPWEARWAHTVPAPYRAIGNLDGMARALAAVECDGRTVIVSAEHSGAVRLWDLATGEPLGSLPQPPGTTVLGLATDERGREPWLLVRYQEHRSPKRQLLALWDVPARARRGPVSEVDQGPVRFTAVGGACVAVVPVGPRLGLLELRTGRRLLTLPGPRRRSHRGPYVELALGEHRGGLVVVGLPRGSRATAWTVAVWSLPLDRPWSPESLRRPTTTGTYGGQVRALTVVDGEVHVSSRGSHVPSTALRSGGVAQLRKQVRQHPHRVREWFLPGLTTEHAFVTVAGEPHLVSVAESRIVLRDQRLARRTEVRTAGWIHTWLPVARADGGVTVVSADSGNTLKVWELPTAAAAPGQEPPPVWGLGGTCVAARHDGRTVLLTAGRLGSRLTVLEVADGRRHEVLPPLSLDPRGDLAGHPDHPPVLHTTRTLLGGTKVWPVGGETRRHVPLRGTTGRGVRELRVTSLDGTPLLLGTAHTSTAGAEGRGRAAAGARTPLAGPARSAGFQVVLWDLDGEVRHVWPSPAVSGLGVRGVETGGELLVSALVREGYQPHAPLPVDPVTRLALHTYPPASPSPPYRTGDLVLHGDPFLPVYDLGLWDGRPALAYLSRSDRVAVRDLRDPAREVSWPLPPHCRPSDLRLLDADGGATLLVATHDQRLLVFGPDPQRPARTIRLGTDILSLAPVDDRLVGVGTATGVLCLRLPA